MLPGQSRWFSLHGKCGRPVVWPDLARVGRDCRACSDRSGSYCFRANQYSEADATSAFAVSFVAPAHPFALGPASLSERDCRLAFVFALLGVRSSKLLAKGLEAVVG